MTKTDRLYLDIIKPFPLEHARLLDRRELAAIKELSVRHGQFMLVYWQLKKNAADNPAVAEFLASNEALYLAGVAISVRQDAIETGVISLLGQGSVPALVIKGSALAKEVYGDINSRVSTDIDILVRYKDAAAADQLMRQNGFVRYGDRRFEFYLLRIHHAQYSMQGDNNLVEMHWHFAIPCYFNLSHEEIWAGVKHEGKDQYSLSPEMNIVLLLMHHHSHAFRHMGVLTDILWALHKYRQTIDWQALLADIKKYGLANAASITCGQIKELWGDYAEELPLAEFRQAGMAGPGPMQRYFGIWPGRTEERAYLDKIAKRLVLDGRRRVLLSFTAALFPPSASIQQDATRGRRFRAYAKYLKEIVGSWLGNK